MKSNAVSIWGAFLFLALILLSLYYQALNKSSGVIYSDSPATSIKQQEISYISIPGFSQLQLKADTIEQDFNFYNPKTNSCIMDVELRLPNGIVSFKENNLKPGYKLERIFLNEPLAVGEYKGCSFIINCHSLNGEQYNGATLTIDLYVR